MTVQVFSQEISRAKVERLQPVRRGAATSRGTRRKAEIRILIDFFEVVWDGTKQRPKDEVQYCPVCGVTTVFHGRMTGHTGSHLNYWRQYR